ncbi:MAG: bacteriohemerythrin [Halieaceae bacterium]|jgi:hemerythrin-like metal-binding protein|nr:bacteriohemerythrin [Halieaceae bacterium]
MRDKTIGALLAASKQRTADAAQNAERLKAELEAMLERALHSQDSTDRAAEAVGHIDENLSSVSATAEELSVNMQQIRDRTRQSEDNIRVVSESTGELATASTDIAQNTERARAVSSKAVSSVEFTLQQVTSLEEVAGEISNVTQVIHDISEQTKVLALNATIEAARAAEAGRGFAVVAREVKDLASETRDATAFIREKVGTIEESIGATITAIKSVSAVINEVNEVVNNIAAAAEEQSISTRSIAENADMASEHFLGISQAIDEGVTGVQDVARRLADAALKGQQARAASAECNEDADVIADAASVAFAIVMELVERLRDSQAEFDLSNVRIDDSQYNAKEGLFQFTTRFSVLVPAMDKDHQKIFDYVNRVHALIKDRAPAGEQVETLREMADFTEQHFAREEAMMQREGFPGLEEQQEQHRMLLDRVKETLAAIARGERVNMIGVLNFLNSWLITHIMKLDHQYGEYFQKQGIKV